MAVLEFCGGVVESVMKSHRLFANVWFEAQCAASVASMSGDGHSSPQDSGHLSHRASAFASRRQLWLVLVAPSRACSGRGKGWS